MRNMGKEQKKKLGVNELQKRQKMKFEGGNMMMGQYIILLFFIEGGSVNGCRWWRFLKRSVGDLQRGTDREG